MPYFNKTSKDRLYTCDIRLQRVFNEVIRTWDCSILCGHRDQPAQNEAYQNGKSSLVYPNSKHNQLPSIAVDAAPYYHNIGVDWKDYIGFAYFAGYVKRVAEEMGVDLRWGGDWDGDKRNRDQNFNDLVHWELEPIHI